MGNGGRRVKKRRKKARFLKEENESAKNSAEQTP